MSLYYVDVVGTEYSILRYSPLENRVYGAKVENEPRVSFIIPVAGTSDEFAVGIVHLVGVIRWDGKSPTAKVVRIALEVENGDEFKTNNFNDAKADPNGRFFGGTLRELECMNLTVPTYGNLFRYSVDNPVVTLNSPQIVRVSNGMAFINIISSILAILLCNNSITIQTREIFVRTHLSIIFHFVSINVVCVDFPANEQILIDFHESNGDPPNYYPDGMTIDTEGNLPIRCYTRWIENFENQSEVNAS